jgi:hypothetical protein
MAQERFVACTGPSVAGSDVAPISAEVNRGSPAEARMSLQILRMF